MLVASLLAAASNWNLVKIEFFLSPRCFHERKSFYFGEKRKAKYYHNKMRFFFILIFIIFLIIIIKIFREITKQLLLLLMLCGMKIGAEIKIQSVSNAFEIYLFYAFHHTQTANSKKALRHSFSMFHLKISAGNFWWIGSEDKISLSWWEFWNELRYPLR